MALSITSIRLDKRLADEAAEVFGVKSRTEAIHAALREIVALKRFKKLMSKYGGKLEFSGHDGQERGGHADPGDPARATSTLSTASS